jgi:hypothetical protein
MEVSGQLHAPAALPPGKEPLVPIRQILNQYLNTEHYCFLPHPFQLIIHKSPNRKTSAVGKASLNKGILKEYDR